MFRMACKKDFEKWFKKEFPEHEDGCLYGKPALKLAWNAACDLQKKTYTDCLHVFQKTYKKEIKSLQQKLDTEQKLNIQLTVMQHREK